MEEQTSTPAAPNEAEALAEQQRAKEKALLAKKYKDKKAQSLSLKEYLKLEAEKKRKPKINLPSSLKLVFAIPLTLLACCGAVFIPYILYQIAIGKNAPIEEKKPKTITYEDLLIKDASPKP